ncbi:MAG: aspartate dehydrogenase [Pseudomonadota bacterium]
MRVGLIGNGAIAEQLLAGAGNRAPHIEITGMLDIADTSKPGGPPVFTDLADLLAQRPDLIVECASHAAIAAHAAPTLEAGFDLVVVSIGSLADADLCAQLDAAAKANGRRVLLPAGAVAGIDGLAAAREEGLAEVSLTTRKPPNAWSGAPGVEGVDLDAINAPTPIFKGSAREAALAFPKNANVAATVALAGIGFEATAVTLIAEPELPVNSHRIDAAGSFGRFSVELFNLPSASNPKTSALTAMSILRLLRNQSAGLVL